MSNKEQAEIAWNWGKANLHRAITPCGMGSSYDASKICRDFIAKICKDYDIKSINDAPCGDYGLWMYDVDKAGIDYTGYDIVDELVAQNQTNFPDVEFAVADITTDVLPTVDLIVCRDCLFHLPNSKVKSALANFKASGSKYLLATHQRGLCKNVELPQVKRGYGYRQINIEIAPYKMEKPLEFVTNNYGMPQWSRELSLWKLND